MRREDALTDTLTQQASACAGRGCDATPRAPTPRPSAAPSGRVCRGARAGPPEPQRPRSPRRPAGARCCAAPGRRRRRPRAGQRREGERPRLERLDAGPREVGGASVDPALERLGGGLSQWLVGAGDLECEGGDRTGVRVVGLDQRVGGAGEDPRSHQARRRPAGRCSRTARGRGRRRCGSPPRRALLFRPREEVMEGPNGALAAATICLTPVPLYPWRRNSSALEPMIRSFVPIVISPQSRLVAGDGRLSTLERSIKYSRRFAMPELEFSRGKIEYEDTGSGPTIVSRTGC